MALDRRLHLARAVAVDDPPQAPPGLVRYDRARDLPRLVSVWPSEIERSDLAGHRALVARIERALRAERRRGLSGHWTYDLARHAQLLAALRHERRMLADRVRREQDTRR
jgi:hypothetical protein